MIYEFYLSTCIPRKSQAIIFLPLKKKKSYSFILLISTLLMSKNVLNENFER